MVINVCDGETVVICDPPLDQDDVPHEVMRYRPGYFATLTVPRGERKIVIEADREGHLYCSLLDCDTGDCIRRIDDLIAKLEGAS